MFLPFFPWRAAIESALSEHEVSWFDIPRRAQTSVKHISVRCLGARSLDMIELKGIARSGLRNYRSSPQYIIPNWSPILAFILGARTTRMMILAPYAPPPPSPLSFRIVARHRFHAMRGTRTTISLCSNSERLAAPRMAARFYPFP